MLVVVDNHDSFTFNLVHALQRFAPDVVVIQGDEIDLGQTIALRPRAVVLSPGPGRPEDHPQGLSLVHALAGKVPLLGVCLGHQTICQAFGARIVHAERLMHGRTSLVSHDGRGVFAGHTGPFRAARYHSLIVDVASLPSELIATAFTEHGELMAVRHARWPIEAVQFHPESFLTEGGERIVQSFVESLPAESPLGTRAGTLGAHV